jgi:hypothetical protein
MRDERSKDYVDQAFIEIVVVRGKERGDHGTTYSAPF